MKPKAGQNMKSKQNKEKSKRVQDAKKEESKQKRAIRGGGTDVMVPQDAAKEGLKLINDSRTNGGSVQMPRFSPRLDKTKSRTEVCDCII